MTDPYLAAYARWREADTLLMTGAGARTRAARALRLAYDTAAELPATPLLARITDLARRARIDLTKTDPPKAAQCRLSPAARLGLSEREAEVLMLVGRGLSNTEIGKVLYISPKTASVHVSNILRKLRVTSRVQAAAIAHRHLLDE